MVPAQNDADQFPQDTTCVLATCRKNSPRTFPEKDLKRATRKGNRAGEGSPSNRHPHTDHR